MRIKIALVASLILLLAGTSLTARASGTFNLADFGAVGDKTTDDGPALQRALDALANAGGGTLIVPAGTYAIITPVFKDFTGLASSVTIRGVASSTVVDTKAPGAEISKGLNLSSEFYPKTGEAQDAIRISGLQSFLIKDIAFVGTPGVKNDAKNTLVMEKIGEAIVRHCEFYGLSSQVTGGSIVTAWESRLKIEQSKFLGSTGNSGVNVPVVQNHQWKGIEVTDTAFVDYGQRPELFGKMTVAPIAWISISSAGPVTGASPRREVNIRNIFLDEGGWIGLLSRPGFYQPYSAKVDLIYITDLTMNVSNFGRFGHLLTDARGVLIEKSLYKWSHNAAAAVELRKVGTAILDRIECLVDANRIHATSETGSLYVIDSTYTTLDSEAQMTKVITTTSPEEDPVQYVRQRYQTTLGRAPDPAGHFYWSDLLLRCLDDAQCIAATRAKLNTYLGNSPPPNFLISGRVTNENGQALSGFTVNLSGSQTVSTQTDATGRYSFSSLPTSGIYTVQPSTSLASSAPPSRTFTTPAGNQTAQDFVVTIETRTISGKLLLGTTGLADQQVRLTRTTSGFTPRTVTTLSDGSYTFPSVPAGYSYTVEPLASKVFSYTPANRVFTNLTANQTGRNFTASRKLYEISGRGLYGTEGLNGVVIQLKNSSGGVIQSVTTATSGTGETGFYRFAGVPAGLSYTVEPAFTNAFYYYPVSRSYANLAANYTYRQHFWAKRHLYVISGKVVNASSTTGISGVTMTLTASSGAVFKTVNTKSDGTYSLTGIHGGGNYTLRPTKTGLVFTPDTKSYTNLAASQTLQNFAGQ